MAFLSPRSKVRTGEEDPKWQERLDAAQHGLKDLIASRARQDFDVAGSNVVPLDFHHGTKRRFGEVEEEAEEEDEEEEEKEEKFNAYAIWQDQVVMTRKYLTENHRQMKAQGNDAAYFSTYRKSSYYWE